MYCSINYPFIELSFKTSLVYRAGAGNTMTQKMKNDTIIIEITLYNHFFKNAIRLKII